QGAASLKVLDAGPSANQRLFHGVFGLGGRAQHAIAVSDELVTLVVEEPRQFGRGDAVAGLRRPRSAMGGFACVRAGGELSDAGGPLDLLAWAAMAGTQFCREPRAPVSHSRGRTRRWRLARRPRRTHDAPADRGHSLHPARS